MHLFTARLGMAAAVCALPLVILLASSSAFAQQAGVYTGTNNEADEVQVVVAPIDGALAVTAMSDGGAVYCMGQQVATYGIEIGIAGQPIVDKKATLDVFATNLYYFSNLKFSGDKVTGTITFAVPLFSGTKQPPKKACAAKTMKQTFTATLSGAAFHAPPAGTARVTPMAIPK